MCVCVCMYYMYVCMYMCVFVCVGSTVQLMLKPDILLMRQLRI